MHSHHFFHHRKCIKYDFFIRIHPSVTRSNTRMPRIIHLIAGYRTTGKDTLHRDLASGHIKYHKSQLPICDFTWVPIWMMFCIQMVIRGMYTYPPRNDVKWYVLGNRSTAIRVGQEYLLVTRDRQQAAFARELKREVHQYINDSIKQHSKSKHHTPLTDEWFEKHKDQLMSINGVAVQPRSLYISMSEDAKKIDPTIWIRKCFESFAPRREAPFISSEIVDITDWRFPNEQIYTNFYTGIYKIFTSRVYRCCIPVIPVPSECSLDTTVTDLLLVPSYGEMILALIRWPQYARHMIIGELRHSAA
jgi:hypothetical protein